MFSNFLLVRFRKENGDLFVETTLWFLLSSLILHIYYTMIFKKLQNLTCCNYSARSDMPNLLLYHKFKKISNFRRSSRAPCGSCSSSSCSSFLKIFAAPAGAARSCFLQLSQNLTWGELCACTLDPRNLTRPKI